VPILVAALRSHDAQLDRTKGKLDTAQDAAYLTIRLYSISTAQWTSPGSDMGGKFTSKGANGRLPHTSHMKRLQCDKKRFSSL
jgi:hypothetical protein